MELASDALADGRIVLVGVELDCYEGDTDILSSAERERLRRMRSGLKRRDFVAGRSALRRLAGAMMEVGPRDVRIAYGAHGKPEIGGSDGLHFNLSHSGDRALLAVSRRGPIGVDIESARPGRPFRRLARRFFARSESAWLEALPAGDVADGFYRLWTLKEAYLKAIGTGLTVSSQALEIDPEGDPPRLAGTPAGQLGAEHWALRVIPTGAGYHAALCAPAGPLELRQTSLLN